ncbi:hypothetical protein MAR_005629 [Mya arenaria]|uniref:Hexosyltransferase n=1 Tax=Mya arenaria TaxID=6604 RepID=A0ABY7F2C8_MYAAR|nr:hypothetical protein MAR_005629 [Mya arenaria]
MKTDDDMFVSVRWLTAYLNNAPKQRLFIAMSKRKRTAAETPSVDEIVAKVALVVTESVIKSLLEMGVIKPPALTTPPVPNPSDTDTLHPLRTSAGAHATATNQEITPDALATSCGAQEVVDFVLRLMRRRYY